MGEGLVLESGTHNELLQNENGAYARLVHAQKLRENQAPSEVETESTASGDEPDEKDMEKAAREEIPLGRRETGSRSLASEILEKRKQEQVNEPKRDYGLWYLFKRIGSLNPAGYKKYMIGSIAAFCMWIFLALDRVIDCCEQALVLLPLPMVLFMASL
jgi:ATP-binding cassette subfamily B (MDR/TAP) protein 1